MKRSLSMIAEPHGGKLVNVMVSDPAKQREIMAACDLEVDLDERQVCDVELLMQGGFSPLNGYMDEADYVSVVNTMHLVNGLIFGLPVVFDTNDAHIQPGKFVCSIPYLFLVKISFGLPLSQLSVHISYTHTHTSTHTHTGHKLLLKYNHVPIAVMEVTSKYTPNKALEAKQCYGTSSVEHPGVMMITTERGK